MTSSPDRADTARPPFDLLDGASLFLDFDGTLVDLAPSPDAVEVSRHLRDLLERLRIRLDGRIAILSGRSALQLEKMLAPVALAIGGHHGLETRSGGEETKSIERPPVLDSLLEELRHLERRFPGVLVESKPLGLALHFRQAPEAEQACRDAAVSAAQSSGLELQPGKMVFELRPVGANKGKALRELMIDPPFAGTRPVFLGDDLTDEPAFAAAQALGGAGILIGDRRTTGARFRLGTVAEALDWLEQACGRTG